MKSLQTALLATVMISILCSCQSEQKENKPNSITGTWQLVHAMLIEKGDTTITDYTKKQSFIKILNDSHFAFLQHDLNGGKDSAVFVAGGGTYTLKDSTYTEHLAYCSAREWEGHDFPFTITIKGDTLTQTGVEKVEAAGVNRLNSETYVRVKNNDAKQ